MLIKARRDGLVWSFGFEMCASRIEACRLRWISGGEVVVVVVRKGFRAFSEFFWSFLSL